MKCVVASARIFVLSVFCLISHNVFAHYPVEPGIENRVSSGIGVITSKGAPSLFHNPANLSLNTDGVQWYYEQSIAYIHLTYDHPDFDKLKFNIFVPPLTAGVVFSIGDKLDVGLGFFPFGTGGTTKVEGLPIDVIPALAGPMDVDMSMLSFEIASGASYQVLPCLSLGLTLSYLFEDDSMKVQLEKKFMESLLKAGGGGVNLSSRLVLDNNWKGHFLKAMLGVRFGAEDKNWEAAIRWSPHLTKTYKVKKHFFILSDSKVEPRPVKYEPKKFALGFTKKLFDTWKFSVEYLYEGFKSGANIVRRGWGDYDQERAALKDSHGVSLSFDKQLLNSAGSISGGVSYFSGNKGDGRFASGDDKGVQGTLFSDFDAIPHYTFAGGYSFAWGDDGNEATVGLKYLTGSKTFSTGTPMQGKYTMDMIFLSGGVRI